MVKFTTIILRFSEQGEKTGWTYIEIAADIAQKILLNNKRSFRVKGKLDNYTIKGVALMPMGGGNFIMPLNAQMRKGIGKRKGAMVTAQLELDNTPLKMDPDLMACINDEPAAKEFLNSLPRSHQNYINNWIGSAKTEPTKTKRIAIAVSALSRNMGFVEMLREQKTKKDLL